MRTKKLCIMLLAMLFCVVTAHAQSFEVDGLSYNVTQEATDESPGEVEVRQSLSGDTQGGQSGAYSGDIVIPDEVIFEDKTYKVTKIGGWAFRLCSELTSITIPYGVTYISNAAFFGCSSLTSVTIPNSVTTIEGPAFGNCSGLTTVVLGNQLETIGYEAFTSCTNLSSVSIPASVTSIGSSAFSGCSGLTSIVVDTGNTVYDSRDNCNAIITKNNNMLIQGCQNTLILNSVTSVADYAFFGCSGLTSITIPASVTSIGSSAFDGCNSLTSITIPNSVTTIGWHAFENCSGIKKITSEISTPFAVDAFSNFDATLVVPKGSSSGYKSVAGWNFAFTFEEGETIYDREQTDDQGVVYTLKHADDDSFYYSVTGHSDEMNSEIVIPADLGGCPVKTIENNVFNGSTNLSLVTIPNSVTTIGARAFQHCGNLTTIILGNQLMTIGRYAFNNCTSLSSVVIPNSVTTIGEFAFYGCSSLTSVTLGNGLTSLEAGSFTNCIGLITIQLPNSLISIGDAARYYAEFSDNGRLVGNFGVFSGCSSLTSVTIGNSVTTIGTRAFEGCKNLSSITIPGSITSIGEYAFLYCDNLDDVKVVVVDFADFCNNHLAQYFNCPLLLLDNEGSEIKEFVIPEGVTSIGAKAFANCSNLTAVILDNQLTDIGEYAFNNCTNISSIVIPDNVTNIGAFAFYGCSGLTSVTIGKGLTSLKAGTFYGCRGINSIQIPNSITIIEDASSTYNFTGANIYAGSYGVFSECSALSSVTIGSGVTHIGNDAFSNCSNLNMVISEIATPFEVHAFNSFDATLIVPKGSRADYKNMSGWDFSYIFEDDEPIYDREQTDNQGVVYTLKQADEGSFFYSVAGHTDDLNAEITIPNILNGLPVKTIGPDAFNDCSDLTSVTIPNNVIDIEDVYIDEHWDYHGAFKNCTNLTSVKMGRNVRSIGSYAFYGCSNLASITLPNNLTNIGGSAFRDCSGLTSVTIGDNVTSIAEYVFSGCTSLSSIEIPNSVMSIGDGTFNGCSGLTSVSIGNSVTSIGESAFEGCTGLSSIIIPNSVISIGKRAFYWCQSLSSVTIGSSVETIGGYAFTGCISLTSITIPNSVTTIGEGDYYYRTGGSGVFSGCGLTSVTIGSGLTHIGSYAFVNNGSLTSVKMGENVSSIGEGAFSNCSNLTAITLPDAFSVIPEGQFSGTNFQFVKLGNNVKSIGKNAFGSNDLVLEIGTSTPPTIDKDAFPNIEYLSDINVIVPDAKAETAYRKKVVWEDMTFSNQNNISEVTVDTPGDLSFELITECNMTPAKVVSLKVNGTINADDFTQMLVNMKSLLRLDLSDCDITEIPDEALKDKTQLQELILPTKLQTIGQSAFQGCLYLKDLTMQNGLQTIGQSAFQGCGYLTGQLDLPSTVTTIGESAFVGTAYTSVKLPSALKTIGDYAFQNLAVSQRLVLPNRVTSVGAYAFAGTKINGLVIPDGVKSIGDNAFAETPIQGHVTIPDGVTYLGARAFKNTQISTVFLPNSVETLSEGLFQDCLNLNLVYVPDNFTGLAGSAFDGCGALDVLRLSANLTSMGEYALQNTPLEYIKVPSKVETLSRGVLRNCTKLESLTLPASLKTVEGDALYGCTALRNMSVEATTPPTIRDRSAIRGINTDKCLISIPTSAYRNYVLAEYWGQFVQMRNDIAVETAGNGEIAFESVAEEEEEEEEMQARAFGPRLAPAGAARRAPTLATEEESLTFANNGSSIYVPQEGKVLFRIIPGDGEELLSATLDGEDIMPYIVDNVYTATADKKNAKLVVKFSGTSSSVVTGDVNGDTDVDIADAVSIVNYVVGKPNATFDEAAADVDGDGEVDIADAVRIVNLVVGKIGALAPQFFYSLPEPQ